MRASRGRPSGRQLLRQRAPGRVWDSRNKKIVRLIILFCVLAAGLFVWRYQVNGIRTRRGDSEVYYFVHGRIAREKSGLVYSDGELWYLESGCVDTEFTGFVSCESGVWYVSDGVAQTECTGLFYGTVVREFLDTPGTAMCQFLRFLSADLEQAPCTGWWYVQEGRVCFTDTIIRQTEGLLFVSQVSSSETAGGVSDAGGEEEEPAATAAQSDEADLAGGASEVVSWCYVENGLFDTAYVGIAENENGKFFVADGSVDFSVEGAWLQEGCTYILENGTVVGEITAESTHFIAHRGLSSEAPENTVRAFILAGEAGFWGCEADVRLTADSRFVILHNKTFYKMCGEKLYPGDLTTEEIESLTIIYGNNLEEYTDDPLASGICFLEDFLEVCLEYGMVPVIDIKEGSTEDAAADAERILLLYETTVTCIGDSEVVFLSFDLDLLILLRQIAKEDGNENVRLQYLSRDAGELDFSVYQEWGIALDLDYEYLEEDTIAAFHASGIEVDFWTPDDVLTVFALLQQGADYITTDCRYW